MRILIYLLTVLFVLTNQAFGQGIAGVAVKDSVELTNTKASRSRRFLATIDFLDACINSLNSFNSLLKKEAYRIKIISLNNPTSSDMGFNLENEVQTALRPLLEKAKNTNTQKFSSIVSTIIGSQSKTSGIGKSLSMVSPIFPTLLSLVGNLSIQEKKITREDLDSFITSTAKYFTQYEKLNSANMLFDQNIDRLNARMRDLQYDLKEYLLDFVTILYKNNPRHAIKSFSYEELFLRFLERSKIETIGSGEFTFEMAITYPSDGIKGAKDLANNLQKLFNDYQKVYADNYAHVKGILTDAKKLGKNVNVQQVDASLKEVDELFNESKSSDILSLRLNTLFERLKILTQTEQPSIK